MGDQDTQQSIWNFDGAELFLISSIKTKIVLAMEEWQLEDAYRKVRLLRMELDAKLSRGNKKIVEDFEKELDKERKIKKGNKKTEKEEVDVMIEELDEIFSKYKEDEHDEDLKKELYATIEKFYMHLCYLMKKHGLYFREGEDMTLAVLRR